jgi:hypothetical protein
MPLPNLSEVHVSRPLTNISIAMLQDENNFVADKVFPVVPVQRNADKYFVYDNAYWNRDEATLRAPATESSGNGYAVDSSSTYSADVYAFHKDISDQIRANADAPINLDDEATKYVTLKMLIRREKLFAASYMASSVWTRDYAGVASAPGANQVVQWSVSGSTPIDDVWAAKDDVLKITGFEPNVLVLGSMTVLKALINHSSVIDRVKYGQSGVGKPAMADLSELAQLFKVDRVLVMRSIQNTANEGATKVHSYIGGKSALLAYAAPSPSIMAPSAGYIFSWSGPGYIGAGPAGNRISKFRMEHLKSDRVEGELAVDCKLVAADLGAFWGSIVA